MVSSIHTPSQGLGRVLRGLSPEQQECIISRYNRLLPVLYLLLSPRSIYERNRTWPSARPIDKAATSYLSPKDSWRARDVIHDYATQNQEDANTLWELFYAYCRYGPIGLIDALGTDSSELVPTQIQEYAQLIRIGKHPRSDAGMYIREQIDVYCDALGIDQLPAFMSRYLFSSQRFLDSWFFPEHSKTALQTKTIRRLNEASL